MRPRTASAAVDRGGRQQHASDSDRLRPVQVHVHQVLRGRPPQDAEVDRAVAELLAQISGDFLPAPCSGGKIDLHGANRRGRLHARGTLAPGFSGICAGPAANSASTSGDSR